MKTIFVLFLSICIFPLISGCSKVDKGVGPVKELKLEEIDQFLADEGEIMFDRKCSTCHRLDEKLIGAPLRGITTRRSPEWIMNMMLNPDGMVKENKAAKELFGIYGVKMLPEDLNERDARRILEFLRTKN